MSELLQTALPWVVPSLLCLCGFLFLLVGIISSIYYAFHAKQEVTIKGIINFAQSLLFMLVSAAFFYLFVVLAYQLQQGSP